jgi:hypothetical protein
VVRARLLEHRGLIRGDGDSDHGADHEPAGNQSFATSSVDASGPLSRLGLGALAIGLLGAFVLRRRRTRAPLVRLGIFRSCALSGGNLAQLLMVAGRLGFQFVGALYLHRSLGYSPAATGVAMVPIPLVIAVVSLACSGRLITRSGTRPVLPVGQALLVAGLPLLTRASTDSCLLDQLPAFAVLGVGAPGTRCPRSPQ